MTTDQSTTAAWSQEAEQSVLGGLLLNNDALSTISGLVDASSFWHGTHRVIFETIHRLVVASQPADTVTVFEAIQHAGKAEEAGGLKYLGELAQCVPSASHIRRYAEIVADKALRRSLLAAADGIGSSARDADTADQAIDQAQTLLASVKRLKAGSEPRSIEALMMARLDHWEALEAGDVTPGIPTGLASLDAALVGGIKPGRVIVLAARPSVGKTSLATQILLSVAGQGHPGLMLSQEMPAGELIDRMAANLGGLDVGHLSTGEFVDGDWTRVTEVVEQVRSLPLDIDDQPALTMLDIRAKARQTKRKRGGLALVVIDYLQLCASTGKADKRHHQIEELSRGMKTLAKELDCGVLLLSQLNRSAAEGEPELAHLKESGAIEEDADTALLLHPMGVESDGSTLVLCKVAKNRGGRRGRLALSFHGRTQQWHPSAGDVSRRPSRGGSA